MKKKSINSQGEMYVQQFWNQSIFNDGYARQWLV